MATSGTITNRRVLVDLGQESVEPDGLTIDTQGNIWSALWDGWAIACFDPTGQELFRVKMPVPRPTSVTFGGGQLERVVYYLRLRWPQPKKRSAGLSHFRGFVSLNYRVERATELLLWL